MNETKPEPSHVVKAMELAERIKIEPEMECYQVFFGDEETYAVKRGKVESIEVDPCNKLATLQLGNGEMRKVFDVAEAWYRPVKAATCVNDTDGDGNCQQCHLDGDCHNA